MNWIRLCFKSNTNWFSQRILLWSRVNCKAFSWAYKFGHGTKRVKKTKNMRVSELFMGWVFFGFQTIANLLFSPVLFIRKRIETWSFSLKEELIVRGYLKKCFVLSLQASNWIFECKKLRIELSLKKWGEQSHYRGRARPWQFAVLKFHPQEIH